MLKVRATPAAPAASKHWQCILDQDPAPPKTLFTRIVMRVGDPNLPALTLLLWSRAGLWAGLARWAKATVGVTTGFKPIARVTLYVTDKKNI